MDKRRLLLVSVIFQALQAAALAALAFSGTTQLLHIYALSLVFGITTTFSIPAGQALVGRLVERSQLQQAVSLNIAIMNASPVWCDAVLRHGATIPHFPGARL